MHIIKMHEIEGKVLKSGVRVKELIKNENVKVMNLKLKPEDSVPAHSVPVGVFFYVVAGKGTIVIGGEAGVVQRDDIVLCPAGTEMSLVADQGEDFSVLNIKTPSI